MRYARCLRTEQLCCRLDGPTPSEPNSRSLASKPRPTFPPSNQIRWNHPAPHPATIQASKHVFDSFSDTNPQKCPHTTTPWIPPLIRAKASSWRTPLPTLQPKKNPLKTKRKKRSMSTRCPKKKSNTTPSMKSPPRTSFLAAVPVASPSTTPRSTRPALTMMTMMTRTSRRSLPPRMKMLTGWNTKVPTITPTC